MNQFCTICDRVPWGEVTLLGFQKWRHDSCYPGSEAWLDYYERIPETQRTFEQTLIYNASNRKAPHDINAYNLV